MSAETQQVEQQPAHPAPPTGTHQCAAWHCPLPGSILSGNQWVCACHRFAAPADWQAVTTRLSQRKKIIQAIQLARTLDPVEWKNRQHMAAEAMRKFGRPDLVPTVIEKTRKIRDRHTGQDIEQTRQLSELESGIRWAYRLESVLFNECVYGLAKADQQPSLVPTAPVWTPPTIGQLVPQNHDEEVFA